MHGNSLGIYRGVTLTADAFSIPNLPTAIGSPERAQKWNHLESQWPVIWGYFVSILGYVAVSWPIFLGYLAFQVYIYTHTFIYMPLHSLKKMCVYLYVCIT